MTETAGDLGSGAAAIPAVIADRYRLDRELGRGGAAIVWLARDLVQDRDVAVKVLRGEIAHTVASNRFLEEIRIDTELAHPHLLPVLGSGDFDGLLYYVTPYVAGGSLRTRMDRERQLPIDFSLAVASDVAGALEYAHLHGVIHRDVKPENILVDGDHAFVADFGIARALTRALDDRITSTGMSVGTPAYMSPEQAAGNRDLDERTDIYSLACVLYEMLAGVAPFVGPSPESVIAQRFLHPPHPLRVFRATVPAEVERAISRAMAIAPADRFRTMGEFAAALRARDAVTGPALAPAPVPERGFPARRRVWLAAGAAAVALAGVVALARGTRLGAGTASGATTADTSRFVVAAVSTDGGIAAPALARQRMVDAFRRWRDISVVETADGDVADGAPRSAKEAATLASRAGAGRVVTGRLRASGDSVELSASLLDARGAVIRERSMRAAVRDSTGVARLYRDVSAAILADADGGDESSAPVVGTDRVAAWRAYTRGRAALSRWDLTTAIRELRVAVGQDAQFAQAQLWLAQAEAWLRPENPDEWRADALRAAALGAGLSSRDSLLASGVASLAVQDFPRACGAYTRAIAVEPRSEFGWFGLGQCQAMDSIVVPDTRSPSGWRFRSSYHSAAMAYDSAIARARGAPAFAFSQFFTLLFAESSRVRQGRLATSDTNLFLAHPSIQTDTLALVPYPASLVRSSSPRTLSPSFAVALSKNADRLDARFAEWVRRSPASADALFALAYVQEIRGEYAASPAGGLAALSTLQSAVRVSIDSTQRIRLTASIVRVLVKSEKFARARDVADSLLRANVNPSAGQAKYLAGVAALIGDVKRAEALLSLASSTPGALANMPVPHPVAAAVARLTADAALGVCNTRLSDGVQDVEQQIERYTAPEVREPLRTTLLLRPLSLAVPCLGPSVVDGFRGNGNRLLQMQRAFGRGDRAVLRTHFDTLTRMRRVDRVGDITLDITYQEAWLLLAIGDTAAAQRHLCTPLSALSTLGPRLLLDVPQAAAVGRSLVMCARLSARSGDARAAAHWKESATTLWSSADPYLKSLASESQPFVALDH